MSNELREFLQAWLDWALASEVNIADSQYFNPGGGLCAYLTNYTNGEETLLNELGELFMSDGLSCVYPFGRCNYLKRFIEATQHLCPLRLAWVKGKLNG